MKKSMFFSAAAVMVFSLAHAQHIAKATDSGTKANNSESDTRVAMSALAKLDPSVLGQWAGPYSWPVVAIHAFMLPTGKVLHFSLPGELLQPRAYTWDPATWQFTPVPINRPLFCSGHSFLSDGRLLVTGGNGPAPIGEFRGIRDAHIFDPFSESWTRIEDMADGRWYPTNVTIADGSVLVFSGLEELTRTINRDVERYQPNDSSGWQILSQVGLPLYPRMHMLSSGDVFYCGPSSEGGIYSIETMSWYGLVDSDYPSRYDGMSVLLPPVSDRVMIFGGRYDSLVTETAEIINFNDAVPTWRYTQPMNFPRMHANSVILPDGKILVAGGHSDLHEDDGGINPTTLYDAEIFDPETETWSVVATMQRPRVYHSTAVLLPDARVIFGGSNSEFTTEIYSPPYLFNGTRPAIQIAPSVIEYGSSFTLEFTSTTDSNTVAALRLASVTHSFDMDQRYVHLSQFSSGDGVVNVNAPESANLAPPGYYMLFVVNDSGVPSEAAMIRMQQPVVCCVGNTGNIDGDPDDIVDISDLTFLIDYLFINFPLLVCPQEGNVDGDTDGIIDIADLTWLIDHLFINFPPTAPCQ